VEIHVYITDMHNLCYALTAVLTTVRIMVQLKVLFK
jgi:hypothetical protein